MTKLRDIPVPTRRALDRFFAGPRAHKIFAIGFNKTGTTSLHRIFENLGYRSLHDDRWLQMSDPLLFRFYDAFSDGFPKNIRALDAAFPRARFILQVRDLDAWLDSRIEHIRRLPSGRNRDPNWNYDEVSVERWVERWNTYHVDTFGYFHDRPEKLLLVNYIRDPEAATKIVNFLGHSAPIEKAFANRNPGAGGTLKNAKMLARILTRLGIPEAEWKNDIHCPSYTHADVARIPADTGRL